MRDHYAASERLGAERPAHEQRPAYFSKKSVRNGPSPRICTMTCHSGAATKCGTPAGMTMKLPAG